MNKNGKVNLMLTFKWVMIVFYTALAYLPCRLFYEYHFCPDIIFYFMIPDEALLAAILTCCWGLWSTVYVKKFNTNYWVKSIIITIAYIYTIF